MMARWLVSQLVCLSICLSVRLSLCPSVQSATNAVLKTAWEKLERNWAVKGFEGAGILPVDKSKALQKCVDANMPDLVDKEEEQEMTPPKLEHCHLADAILCTIAPAATEECMQREIYQTFKKKDKPVGQMEQI